MEVILCSGLRLWTYGLHFPFPSYSQLKMLKTITSESEKVHPSLELLTNIVQEFRDDELEHLDTAVEHDAQQAPAHALLSAIIGFGCKGAIQIAKRF